MVTKLNYTKMEVDEIFAFLQDNNLFKYDELLLVIKCYGDNKETYDTICYCRYGYTFDQLIEELK